MVKTIKLGLLFLFVGLLAVEVKAQDIKVGYLDPQLVLERMPEMAAVQMRIKNFRDRKGAEIQQKEAAFIQAQNEFQQRSGVISEAARQEGQAALASQYQDLQSATATAQQEINQRTNELLGPLLTQLRQAIDAVAAREGLSYVLNTTTNSGDQIILYVSQEYASKYDITNEVMQQLGI